jgi:hypothetical protein
VPFSDESAVVVERTDGAGPPRRGWLHDAHRSTGAPGGLLAGAVWLLSRHGRVGRAMVLHEHLRERRDAGQQSRQARPARRRRPAARGFVLGAIRRLRLFRRRPRSQVAAGLLAAPLALPAIAVVLAAIVVLLVADVALWAVLAVGASIRTAAGARSPEEATPPSFDWTPS